MKRFGSIKAYYARKMKPYGEQVGGQIRTRASERHHMEGATVIKMTLSEWKRIKRQPKKRARREGNEEIIAGLQDAE